LIESLDGIQDPMEVSLLILKFDPSSHMGDLTARIVPLSGLGSLGIAFFLQTLNTLLQLVKPQFQGGT